MISPNIHKQIKLNFAVLSVSDTHCILDDIAGASLVNKLKPAGHYLITRMIVQDDIHQVCSIVSEWIADERVQVILVTGSNKLSSSGYTPQGILPLFDKVINGSG